MEATMPIRFDKLRFVKKLQEAKQSPEIAEALANALDDALEQSQSALLTRAEFKQEMASYRAEIDTKLAQTETRLTASMYKMAGFILAGTGVLMSLMKFIN